MKLIYIEWCDAISSGAEWTNANDLDRWIDGTEWIIKQTGWILHEDKKCLTICSQIKPEDDFTDIQYGHLQKIPKTWIRRRIDLTKHIK